MGSDTNVYLRNMTLEDTERIVKWRNSEESQKNSIRQELFTKEGHLQWVRSMVDTGKVVQMMICDSVSHEPIGVTSVKDIDKQHKKAEFSILIGEDKARGLGYGTQAGKLMVQYGFQVLGLHKIYLKVYASNIRAIRSYEKVGFVKEACLHDDIFVGGQFHDIVMMAVLNNAQDFDGEPHAGG